MNKFILQHIIQPFRNRWMRGIMLLFLWTIAFIALPALSAWFLATCSIVFITANTLFSYLIPSAIIRMLALVRTATRYFEKVQNHTTTLKVHQNLRLKIFGSIAKYPYFQKQSNNNSNFLENSIQGIDLISNYVLLWLLPLATLSVSIIISALILTAFSQTIAVEFIISSAVLFVVIPQWVFRKNKKLYSDLKTYREENQQHLIESFRGRIEISKYGLESKVIDIHNRKKQNIEKAEKKLHISSFFLQLTAGFGLSVTAAVILYQSKGFGISVQTVVGVFFGILAQAELAEMLFSGQSERNRVAQRVADIQGIFVQGAKFIREEFQNHDLKSMQLENWSATIPETTIYTKTISLNFNKGEWITLFGETGRGKSTFLNSLFYPEYHKTGKLLWNNREIPHLMPPECIYVTQKAYLQTGTLRENFQNYADEEIEKVLGLVDLKNWLENLPNGLDTFLGENGETLSGGQRKKLLLAQALLKKPELLVVDEPTAGISADNALHIFETIRNEFPDITILMATHLKEFEKVSDTILRL